MKWAREEYKEVITVFYQALKKPQNNHTKLRYETWRAQVGQNKLHMDGKKLANARRDRLKKNRLTSAEVEAIRKTKS